MVLFAIASRARSLGAKHPLFLYVSLPLLHSPKPISTSPSSLSHSKPFSSGPSQTPLGFNPQRLNPHTIPNSNLTHFLKLLQTTSALPSDADAMASLDDSGVEPKRDLVVLAIWAMREDWKSAFMGFKWGEKRGCCDEEACSLMVWVLGSHRKFTTAWCLIRDLNQALLDTRRAMLIMIDRYASANHPGKAIKTFKIMEKFRLSLDQEAFHILLNALCKNGNMEEAEEFMLVSKKFFPLEVEGFNIVLDGWCNVSVDVYQAKRVWREMSKYCITPDATSYTHMISCFSKVGNLFDSLRLYDEMKKRDMVPSLEVYNSLIYVLTHEKCFKEALKVLNKVKEMGLQPDATTYNAMIGPLCVSKKLEEARPMLSDMMNDNISPTVETYHAFLQSTDSMQTLEVLDRMKRAKLGPNGNTFLIILERFFILEQPRKALEIWNAMKNYGVVPESTHYTAMVKGLADCGWLAKGTELSTEMKSKGFSEDPKIKMRLNKPLGESVKGKPKGRQPKQAKRKNLKQGMAMR